MVEFITFWLFIVMERTIKYQFCSHNSDNIYAYLNRINKFLEDYYSVYFQKEDVSFDNSSQYEFHSKNSLTIQVKDLVGSF